MDNPKYLPASSVKAGSLRLGRLSVRTRQGVEIGKLLGFVIDAHHIRSLVVEADASQIELPMGPTQFDPLTRSLRIQDDACACGHAFVQESTPEVDVDDLWVPLFQTASAA